MNLTRIKYLRGELEAERIDLVELAEIEEAFMGMYVPGEPIENAMASDMLDVLETRVSPVERTIYHWVQANFGESEANDPSWDISSLAKAINETVVPFGAEYLSIGKIIGE